MRKIEKSITKKENYFEISEDEFTEIMKIERNKGRTDILCYIAFSAKNYYLKLNTAGIFKFMNELCDFLNGETSIIENTYNYSFYDYLKKYR